MIRLLFVGDGKRDAATVPPLVETILDTEIDPETRIWARLHASGRKGYDRKLVYALLQARDLGVPGVVATVDSDKEPKGKRLRSLQKGRISDREKRPPLPTALGEAVPHGEAWLFDDPAAVRTTLRLSDDLEIPTLRETRDPKKMLNKLCKQSPRAQDPPPEVLAEIAKCVDPARCSHAKQSGFLAFTKEVHSELGSLLQSA